MRTPRWTLALAAAAVGSALFMGCSQPVEEAAAPSAPSEQAASGKPDAPAAGVETVVLNAKGMH